MTMMSQKRPAVALAPGEAGLKGELVSARARRGNRARASPVRKPVRRARRTRREVTREGAVRLMANPTAWAIDYQTSIGRMGPGSSDDDEPPRHDVGRGRRARRSGRPAGALADQSHSTSTS